MRCLKRKTIGLFVVAIFCNCLQSLVGDDLSKPAQVDQSEFKIDPKFAIQSLEMQFRKAGKLTDTASVIDVKNASMRAVGASLNWLSRHQLPDGSWRFDNFAKVCQDESCTGSVKLSSQNAATALTLLAYFGAGQTHKAKGPYRKNLAKGLEALVKSEKGEGDFSGADGDRLAQALATYALCDAFGLTKDEELRKCAQRAIKFLHDSDTSRSDEVPDDLVLFSWQMMAIRSASMEKLNTDEALVRKMYERQKLIALAKQERPPLNSSIKLMFAAIFAIKRNCPAIVEPTELLMANLPKANSPNAYYWLCGTRGMYYVGGDDWDKWRRHVRRTLVESQVRYGCAAGSWGFQEDNNCEAGGRLFVTCLNTLTLEVQYRYAPYNRASSSDEILEREPGDAAETHVKSTTEADVTRRAGTANGEEAAAAESTQPNPCK